MMTRALVYSAAKVACSVPVVYVVAHGDSGSLAVIACYAVFGSATNRQTVRGWLHQ